MWHGDLGWGAPRHIDSMSYETGGVVSTTRNGEVEIYFEVFGEPNKPTLLLINGLGSQCINYAVEWCQLFCDEGFAVVRFDNRDVGLSTKLEGFDYSL
jgi:pimeloyl-ACP methyl ester carboxylesterase